MQARGALLLSIYPMESTGTAVRVFIGLALFLLGMLTNIHADYVLRNLRKPGETGYKISRGKTRFFLLYGFNLFEKLA